MWKKTLHDRQNCSYETTGNKPPQKSLVRAVLLPSPGDEELRWFSHDPAAHVVREQLLCHLTHTTAATHRLIRENLLETPIYGGWVDSKGPRYCPSIEDKIVRFADKESHQVRAGVGSIQDPVKIQSRSNLSEVDQSCNSV